MSKKKTRYYIDYHSAVHWLNGALVLCNDIPNIDPGIYDKMEWYEDSEANREIYQYFLTSYSKWDVDWFKDTFPDLIFTYSDKLDLYVLCVDHWGTSWDYVWTTCKLPEDVLPDKWNEKDTAETEHQRTYKIRWMRCK